MFSKKCLVIYIHNKTKITNMSGCHFNYTQQKIIINW